MFFKFINRPLNFSLLLSRSENGIKVVLYVTMIAAVLVMTYRKLIGQGGFKLAKQQLAQELETEIEQPVPESFYYTTFTIVQWADIFTRRVYRDIVVESFNYCIAQKGLRVHGYVFMTNHIHCIL